MGDSLAKKSALQSCLVLVLLPHLLGRAGHQHPPWEAEEEEKVLRLCPSAATALLPGGMSGRGRFELDWAPSLCPQHHRLFAGLGICTAFLCVTWSLLDYHQSLRSFLQDKYELSWGSSVVYFLWNLFLVCPRILAVALFALLWPYGVAVHFPLVWLAMFLWVSLQGTDFMESPGPEQLYRAMVAVILYFSWFNVAEGRTLSRSIIYHSFILVDSTLLVLAWLWGSAPSDEHSYLVPVVSAALPCYLLGLVLKVTYYQWLHPNVWAQQEGGCDEVDAEGRTEGPGLLNRRMQGMAQIHFPIARTRGLSSLNGAAAAESAV